MRVTINPFPLKQPEYKVVEHVPRWITLTDGIDAPGTAGIYFFGTPFSISYPKKASQVFYIGSSTNIRSRLRSHFNRKNRGNFLLKNFLEEGTKVFSSWLSLSDYDQEEIVSLEYNTFVTFGKEYGLVPYGNRIPPEGGPLNKTISLKEEKLPEQCLTPEDLANHFGIIYKIDPYPVVDTDFLGLSGSEDNEIYSGNFYVKPKSGKRKSN